MQPEKLGLNPDRCAALEDSPRDVAGACSAVIRCVGFVGGSRNAHRVILTKAGATPDIETLEEAFEAMTGHLHAPRT